MLFIDKISYIEIHCVHDQNNNIMDGMVYKY